MLTRNQYYPEFGIILIGESVHSRGGEKADSRVWMEAKFFTGRETRR